MDVLTSLVLIATRYSILLSSLLKYTSERFLRQVTTFLRDFHKILCGLKFVHGLRNIEIGKFLFENIENLDRFSHVDKYSINFRAMVSL